jgi:cytochrome c oxidase subunit 2
MTRASLEQRILIFVKLILSTLTNCFGRNMRRLSTYVALLFTLAWVVPVRGSGKADDEPRRIEITAHRFAFQPNQITLQKGQPVIFIIKSTDVSHGMRVQELGINLVIHKGAATEARFTPEKTGDFVGHCSVFCGGGHGGMTITLHVVG